jgi:O-antigen/teichoic acid export membrane protein
MDESLPSPENVEFVTAAELAQAAEPPVGPPSTGAAPGGAPGRRRSVAFLVGALAGGNILSSALRMAGGMLQGRWVSPLVLGQFNAIGLVQDYSQFLQLGILNGLNRELPYFFGKGDRGRVNELAAAAQAWTLGLGAVEAVVLVGVAFWYLLHGNLLLAAGWASYAVTIFLFFYGTLYLQATYRTAHDFAQLSLVNVMQNALAVVLLALVLVWGFYGLCLRAVVSGLLATAMLYYWRPIRVAPRWNFGHWKHLLAIGLPIFIVGLLYGLWVPLEKTLVLNYLGKEGLGLYQMVVVAATTMELVPLAVGQVVYPRMAEQFGRTHQLSGLLGMAVKPMLVTAAAMVPLVIVGWWLAEPLTRIVMPKYLAAVPAMKWALLAPWCSSFGVILNAYNVVRRQGLYAVTIVLGMASYTGILFWLIRGGASLVAFPQAMLVGRVVYLAAGYVFLLPLVAFQKKSRRS